MVVDLVILVSGLGTLTGGRMYHCTLAFLYYAFLQTEGGTLK